MSFRTATESFNRDWYFAVRDGRIWMKPNDETGERRAGEWELVGATGLPEGGGLDRWDPPTSIAEISADGAHLQAISAEWHIYRATDARADLRGHAQWTDRWGWPRARGPWLSVVWPTDRGWSVSDSHPFQVDHYEDAFGYEHTVGLGVAHVYRLTQDGRQIAFNDWWLSADWSRRVCGPERGTVESVALSASASTLLLLARDGGLWTRLYDFDTSGENDLLRYSWVMTERDGRVTRRLAIAQDGQGNAARVLRVEAERDGLAGYWEKRVFGEAWTWVPLDGVVPGPFLDELPEAEPLAAPDDLALSGALARQDLVSDVQIELLDFNLVCSPARARLLRARRADLARPVGDPPRASSSG